MTTTGIRKVAMPQDAVNLVKDYAWRSKQSVSLVVRTIIDEYRSDPESFRALPDMEGTLSESLTIYVPAASWLSARDIAYLQGRVPISVIIRKGLRARMEAEDIPVTA